MRDDPLAEAPSSRSVHEFLTGVFYAITNDPHKQVKQVTVETSEGKMFTITKAGVSWSL